MPEALVLRLKEPIELAVMVARGMGMGEKMRVAALAGAEAKGLDEAGVPTAAIVRMLKASFQPRYKWIKDFVAEPLGGLRYEISMIASKVLVARTDDSDVGKKLPGKSGSKRLRDEEFKKLTQEQQDFITQYRSKNPASTLTDEDILDYHARGYKIGDDTGAFYHPDSGKFPKPVEPHTARYKDKPKDAPEFDEFDAKLHLSPDQKAAQTAAVADRKAAANKLDDLKKKKPPYDSMSPAELEEVEKKLLQEMRNASEELGSQAGHAWAQKNLTSSGFRPLPLPGHKANSFDAVYHNPKTGEVVIIEYKGGKSGSPDRLVDA